MDEYECTWLRDGRWQVRCQGDLLGELIPSAGGWIPRCVYWSRDEERAPSTKDLPWVHTRGEAYEEVVRWFESTV